MHNREKKMRKKKKTLLYVSFRMHEYRRAPGRRYIFSFQGNETLVNEKRGVTSLRIGKSIATDSLTNYVRRRARINAAEGSHVRHS